MAILWGIFGLQEN